MILREFNESDLEEIKQLFYNTIQHVNVADYSKEQVDVWSNRKDLLTSKRFLESETRVVIHNDQIVGYGNIKSDGEYDHLYVHKDYQHQGIATMLCNELENLYEGEIYVYASISAKEFFIHRGYEIMCENLVEIENVELKNYLMKKSF